MAAGGFTAIVDTLLYLFVPLAPAVLAFLFRKRIVRWFARQLGPYVVQGLYSWAFVEEAVEDADGKETQRRALSVQARALLATVVPVLMAEVVKNVKIKMPGQTGLPAGIDLSNISEVLPSVIGMLPKKIQPLVALAAPFLGQFLGGGGAGGGPPMVGSGGGKAGMSEITRKLIP